MTLQQYDFVIVGGGTAGCVIAARLSEDPAVKVLLVEAGMDIVPDHEPEAVLAHFPATYADPRAAWPGLIAEVGADPGDGNPVYTRQFNQARMLGGCSSINGMIAQRGLPSDYDDWEAKGASGWGWQGVLPYFIKLEHDLDCTGPLHGEKGPIGIRRCPRDDAPPYASAMVDAMIETGATYHPDMNAHFGDCVTMSPLNNTARGRSTTATAYLTAEVRRRPNLCIVTDTVVSRLSVSGARVTGIEGMRDGRPVAIAAGEVIVCAGAIHTPALLMRSGIGPAEQLRQAGLPVHCDRAGVGQSLFNHPGVFLATYMPESSVQDAGQDIWASTLLRYSSGYPGCPDGDMQIFPVNRSAWHPLGWRVGVVGMYVYKAFSQGSVELNRMDPYAPPTIRFKLLSDKRDFDRLVDCVAKTAGLLEILRQRGVIHDAFVPPGGQANSLNSPGMINYFKALAIRWIFDLSHGLRRFLLRRNLVDLVRLTKDRQACERIVRENAAGVHHVSGTCRMGAADDPQAVVDPRGRVHGIDGLRVADASIMPAIVSGNTHIPVVMIGEKMADLIREDSGVAMARKRAA